MRVREDIQRWGGRVLLISTIGLLVLGIYLPVVHGDRVGGMAILLIALAIAPLTFSIYLGRFELFEPIIFHTVFFAMLVIGWIERLYVTRDPLAYEVISWSFEEGMLIAGGALAVFFAATVLGYYILGPPIASRFTPVERRITGVLASVDRLSGMPFRVIGGLYMLIGLGAIAATIVAVFPTNEILYLFVTDTPRSQIFAGNGVFVLVSSMLFIGYFLWLCGAIADRRTPMLTELLAAVPVTAIYLLLGGRGQALSIAVVTAIIAYYTVIENIFELNQGLLATLTDYVPPGVLVLFLPIIGAGMALAVVALQGMRFGQSLAESAASIDIFSILTAGVHTDIYDNFLVLLEYVPRQADYFYGAFYARIPMNFIPRAVWPEKPVSTSGGFLRRLALPDQTGGRPPGAIGDSYLNFGPPGIPIVGLVYGVLLYLTWRLVHGARVSSLSLLLFGLIVVTIGKDGLTNNILISLAEHLVVLTPAIVMLVGWEYYTNTPSGESVLSLT